MSGQSLHSGRWHLVGIYTCAPVSNNTCYHALIINMVSGVKNNNLVNKSQKKTYNKIMASEQIMSETNTKVVAEATRISLTDNGGDLGGKDT